MKKTKFSISLSGSFTSEWANQTPHLEVFQIATWRTLSLNTLLLPFHATVLGIRPKSGFFIHQHSPHQVNVTRRNREKKQVEGHVQLNEINQF